MLTWRSCEVPLRWQQSALQELAEIWIDASSSDRSAINDAVRSIEHELGQSPENSGESREGRERLIFESPVAVLFDVSAEEAEVVVLQIWRYR